MTTPTARAADGSGKITRDAVLAAALEIIDRDGAEALSMRRLAAPGPRRVEQLAERSAFRETI
jgi:DNA-binding transcriptional regulator YbjK